MAVGANSLFSGESYLGIGRETAFGTGVTATAGLDFISSSIKTTQDTRILETISRKRTHAKNIRLGKVVEGDVSFYACPDVTAMGYVLQNAFGGTVTSATATGETTGGAGYTHTFNTGNMEGTHKALTFNERKGDATNGKVFEYIGGRVNNLSIAAEIDEPLVMTASMVFKDSTVGATDVESLLKLNASEELNFAGGRFSVETAFGSLTTSSFWHVQSINYGMSNSLKNDAGSRRIGSRVLDVLPPGIQSYELSVTMRFDTTTAYDAMMNSTQLAGEFEFLGSTMAGSAVQRGLKLQMPKLQVKDAGDPEIGGPDETLTATVTFDVLRDDSTSTGFAVKALMTNLIASY